MRIHTALDKAELGKVATLAGVGLARQGEHGSRSNLRAFEVRLEGSSNGWLSELDGYAATWDQWGKFFEYLFRADPTASCRAYPNHEAFRWLTGNRFDAPETLEDCGQHKWEYQGRAITGTYAVTECRKCGAIQRSCTREHLRELAS